MEEMAQGRWAKEKRGPRLGSRHAAICQLGRGEEAGKRAGIEAAERSWGKRCVGAKAWAIHSGSVVKTT